MLILKDFLKFEKFYISTQALSDNFSANIKAFVKKDKRQQYFIDITVS